MPGAHFVRSMSAVEAPMMSSSISSSRRVDPAGKSRSCIPIRAVATSAVEAAGPLVSPTPSQISRLDRTFTGQHMQEMFWEEVLHRRMGGSSLQNGSHEEDGIAELASCSASNHVWRPEPGHLTLGQLWTRLRVQASSIAKAEPVLSPALQAAVLTHKSLGVAMAALLASKLSSRTLLATPLSQLFARLYEEDLDLLEAASADMQATLARNPACEQELHCFLYAKGWQATQAHRAAHALWSSGRQSLALALQSRSSEAFGVDIHPAASLGRGLLLDHGTGIVIGETCVIGDNVSLMQGVTLGGSGTGKGRRHPTVEHACLLGAGASLLGPVRIGHCSRVGAGSIVIASVPPHSLAVGVPARIIKRLPLDDRPCESMEQGLNRGDDVVDYII